jgi:hypothetical protein
MQRFAGKTIVVKYGGAAMKDPTLKVCYLAAVLAACFRTLKLRASLAGAARRETARCSSCLRRADSSDVS